MSWHRPSVSPFHNRKPLEALASVCPACEAPSSNVLGGRALLCILLFYSASFIHQVVVIYLFPNQPSMKTELLLTSWLERKGSFISVKDKPSLFFTYKKPNPGTGRIYREQFYTIYKTFSFLNCFFFNWKLPSGRRNPQWQLFFVLFLGVLLSECQSTTSAWTATLKPPECCLEMEAGSSLAWATIYPSSIKRSPDTVATHIRESLLIVLLNK